MVWQDVDQRGAFHPIGVVEAHARRGAGPAVVTGAKELAVAEFLHHFDLVLRHRAERVVDVVLAGVIRPDTVAIAAQVGRDDMEVLGQAVGDLAPGGMCQRIAVQQQQWRAVPAVTQMNARAAKVGSGGLDIDRAEALEHVALRVICGPA
jgi:hypothetical protein